MNLRKRDPSPIPGDADPQSPRRAELALQRYGVRARTVNVVRGPTITRYELELRAGDIRMRTLTGLRSDLAYALAAQDVRILAPIPGREAFGVEVPTEPPTLIKLDEMLPETELSHPLDVLLGVEVDGSPVVTNLGDFPHAILAGTTGSGKSVALHTILCSLLYRDEPSKVKLVLVDPKMVELTRYEGLPNLLVPPVTNAFEALDVFDDLIGEMNIRYEALAAGGYRNIDEYNADGGSMPYIVAAVDELADLIMAARKDAERLICTLAQKSRAVGIHLLLATQTPRVSVITGMIKANCPTRIAFAVASQMDSRVILDTGGAETLLGKGDALLSLAGSAPVRFQGALADPDTIDTIISIAQEAQ